ncbi:hypothetical protein Psfp_03058 [Pelotomaculum sp. FP]|uniref:hypothetical protein n=1 Tax=Pelotomaculum sp. FP TaxID=261474 RepID=UPI001064962A|nr:hypothetical protein [Pelotomaculum sp. FP]TEB14237.1 hypothetical protein Psfp_03058 [Pelotomaculum sp. FP]
MNINHSLVQTLSWLAVLFCMLAIYLLSAQPAGFSKANSKGIVTRVVDTTVKLTNAISLAICVAYGATEKGN